MPEESDARELRNGPLHVVWFETAALQDMLRPKGEKEGDVHCTLWTAAAGQSCAEENASDGGSDGQAVRLHHGSSKLVEACRLDLWNSPDGRAV